MIDGTERAFPSTYGDTFANEGLTIKQHMMIEFTKAIVSAILTNVKVGDRLSKNSTERRLESTEYIAIMAEEYADGLIKQFNKNGDT